MALTFTNISRNARREAVTGHYVKFFLEGVPSGYTVLPDTSVITATSDWEIDWGDGTKSFCSSLETALPQHRYIVRGNYTITITGDITGISAVGADACPIITNNKNSNSVLVKVEVDDASLISSIGHYAFCRCHALAEFCSQTDAADSDVSHSQQYEAVGDSAFEDCYALVKCTWLSTARTVGAKAFANCYKLVKAPVSESSIVLERATSIGERAFENCRLATGVIISSALKTIGSYALSGCKKLTSVTFLGDKPEAGENLFSKVAPNCKIYVFESYRTWGDPVIAAWQGLPIEATNNYSPLYEYETDKNGNVTILRYKGSEAEVIVPKTIGGNPVKSINGFINCPTLVRLTIPEGVERLGNNAISFNENLFSVELPSTLTQYTHYHFWGCTSLRSITIPEGTTEIANGMFTDCTGLVQVVIPSTVKTIGDTAFQGCSNLSDFALPVGLTSIGEFAFSRCDAITQIDIPATVKGIGKDAFSSCAALSRVDFYGDFVGIGEGAFANRKASIGGYVDLNSHGWEPYITNNYGALDMRYRWTDLYDYSSNGTSITIQKYKGTESAVAVPSSMDGLPVMQIGSYAFTGNNLITIVIPETIRTISQSAFYGCLNLEKMVFEGDAPYTYISSFVSCPKCTVIVSASSRGWNTSIPGRWRGLQIDFDYTTLFEYKVDDEGEVEIKRYYGDFAKVTVPRQIDGHTVTRIGDGAFSMWDEYGLLREIVLPDTIKSIGEWAFSDLRGLRTINLPQSLTSIGRGAFDDTALTSVNCPLSVTSVEDYTFSNCLYLRNVYLHTEVVSIGSYAFGGCSSLSSISLPRNLEAIENYAFAYCTALESITIPPKVKTLEGNMFYQCESLASVELHEGLEALYDWCFGNCTSLKYITIPSTVTSIGNDCFIDCIALETVFMKSPASLGGYCFYGCSSLKEFVFPEGEVEEPVTVGKQTFYGCSSMIRVIMHPTIANLPDALFFGCSSLDRIVFLGDAPTVGREVFSSVPLSCHVQVTATSTGWGVSLPGKWNGLFIEGDFRDTYEYTIKDREVRIDRFVGSSAYAIEMPDTILGYAVTIIGKEAFKDIGAIYITKFPSMLREIDDRAFYGASFMDNSVAPFPASLMRIGEKAFFNPDSDSSWTYSLTFEGDAPAYGYRAFGSETENVLDDSDSDDAVAYKHYTATVYEETTGWTTEREEVPYPYSGTWHGVPITSARRHS